MSDECACCKNGIEAIRIWERQMMEKHGWYAHYVSDDPDLPCHFNCHSHGFPQTFKHPDFQVVLPLDQQVAHSILCRIVEKLRAGEHFVLGQPTAGIIGGDYKVMFVAAVEDERPVWRVILPDKTGALTRDKQQGVFRDQWHGCVLLN